MKKILLIIFLISIFIIKVKAETFYSSYGPFSAYGTERKVVDDTINEEVERRYRWYEEIYQSGGYHNLGTSLIDYPYINYDNSYQTEFTPFSKSIPETKEGRIIETRNIYNYYFKEKVKYIYLKDIFSNSGSLNISELNILINNNLIQYGVNCQNCSNNLSYYIYNGIINENMAQVYNGGYLFIDLYDYYNIEDIELKIYLYDQSEGVKNFNISISNSDYFGAPSFTKTFNDNFISVNYATIPNLFTFKYDDTWEGSINDKIITSYEELEFDTQYYDLEIIKEYRYSDLKYEFYNLKRNYHDEYLTFFDKVNYQMDNNDYMDFYRYQERNKIVIDDEFIISDNNQSLYDMIKETNYSKDAIKITNNIDYGKAGNYEVIFSMPNLIVKKIVNFNKNDQIVNKKISNNSLNTNNDQDLSITKEQIIESSNSKKDANNFTIQKIYDINYFLIMFIIILILIFIFTNKRSLLKY